MRGFVGDLRLRGFFFVVGWLRAAVPSTFVEVTAGVAPPAAPASLMVGLGEAMTPSGRRSGGSPSCFKGSVSPPASSHACQPPVSARA